MKEYSLDDKLDLVQRFGHLERRNIFENFSKLLHKGDSDSNFFGKVIILYGLRRTGKSVMLAHAMTEMSMSDIEKTVYIDCQHGDKFSDLALLLKKRREEGAKYIFLDEAGRLSNFIPGSSLLHDSYTRLGIPVVLSGTDSLIFRIALDDELFDRADVFHTTFISWSEYSRLKKVYSLDAYIENGGILSGKYDNYPFTAIGKNIQSSLFSWNEGDSYLKELAEKNELASIVNRIVEARNHSIVKHVLEKKYSSRDLGSLVDLLGKKEATLESAKIVSEARQVIEEIHRQELEIKNSDEMRIKIDEFHVAELERWLQEMELFHPRDFRYPVYKTKTMPPRNENPFLCNQVGLRWAQAESLVSAIEKAKIFDAYDINAKNAVFEKLKDDIRGQLFEEITINETFMEFNKFPKNAFSIFTFCFDQNFSNGKYDMVIHDAPGKRYWLFEIKHSGQISDWQSRHLKDKMKIALMNRMYGSLEDRSVIYAGKNMITEGGIHYVNIENYLEMLPAFAESVITGQTSNPEIKQKWSPSKKNLHDIVIKIADTIFLACPFIKLSEPENNFTDSLAFCFPFSEEARNGIEKLFLDHPLQKELLNIYDKTFLLFKIDLAIKNFETSHDVEQIKSFRNRVCNLPDTENKDLKPVMETFDKTFDSLLSNLGISINVPMPDEKVNSFIVSAVVKKDRINLGIDILLNNRPAPLRNSALAGKEIDIDGLCLRIPDLPEDSEYISILGMPCDDQDDLDFLAETFLNKTFPAACLEAGPDKKHGTASHQIAKLAAGSS